MEIGYHAHIENCYNTGSVTASEGGYYTYAAGIYGYAVEDTVSDFNRCINSYNVGSINGANSNGYGIIGRIGYNGNTNKVGYSNNYSINSAGTAGTQVTSDTLKTYADQNNNVLGNAFVKDENGINDGYPVLKWQIE